MSVQESSVYRRIKLLGQGSFGNAYLVERIIDHKQLVMKQMDLRCMTDNEKKDAYREARILAQLKHPNIIHFQEVYKTKKGKLCIIMDYADGGDLALKIKDQTSYFSENQILDWFTQLCLAVKHCHDRKILHRDIKSQNIFLTKDGRVKLGDFGIAKVLRHTREKLQTMVGTPYYLAPELVENRPYSFSGDMWSLGVVLYEMCALKPPFDGDNLPQLCMRILGGNYQPIPSIYSNELKSLVASLLRLQENTRISVYEVLKLPIITERIQIFLSETTRISEFAHTILHNQNILNKKEVSQPKPYSINESPRNHRPPVKKPATPTTFLPEIPKKDSVVPTVPTVAMRVQTPTSVKPKERKAEEDPKAAVRLPELKLNFAKMASKEQDQKPYISRQMSKVLKAIDQSKNHPYTPSEKQKVRVSEIAVKRLPSREVISDDGGGKYINKQQMRMVKSPSAFDAVNRSKPSDRLQEIREKISHHRMTPSEDHTTIKQRLHSVKVNISTRNLEKMLNKRQTATQQSSDVSSDGQAFKCEQNLEDERHKLETTLQKISEHNSERKSPSKLSIQIQIDETTRSAYLNGIHSPQLNEELEFNFSLTKSQIVKGQSNPLEKTIERRRSVEQTKTTEQNTQGDKETKQESISQDQLISHLKSLGTNTEEQNIEQTSHQRFQSQSEQLAENTNGTSSAHQDLHTEHQHTHHDIHDTQNEKKRKIIYKDPFQKQTKLKRVDSEEELKLMVQELQSIITYPVPQMHIQQNNQNLSRSNSSYEDSMDDIENEEDLTPLDKKIKDMRGRLIGKLGEHYKPVYDLAHSQSTSKDLGKSQIIKKIMELMRCTDKKKANALATLMVTLVVLAKA